MKQETLTRISALLEGEDVDEALLEPLAAVCSAALTRRLRPDADPETHCPEIYALAVSLLIRAEVAGLEEDAATSFTLGDVSLSGLSPSQRQTALRSQAERLLGGYLRPAGFAFQGVVG